MFCLQKHREKKKCDVCSTLGKNFVVTPAARQQKIIFLMNLPLRKCVKILSIQKKRGSLFEKHTRPKQVLQGPSLQRRNTRQPTQPTTAMLQQEEQQPGIQTKELEVMEHTRGLEISSLILLLREKANSYCASNISNYYEHWRSISSDKYILSIVLMVSC